MWPSRYRCLALIVFLVFALPAICAAPEALLYSSPGTTVDGVPAFNGSRVFVSSVLYTPKGRFSELILTGNAIRLLEDTNSRFLGDSMDVLTGGVTLKTSTGFSIHSECMTATPAEGSNSRYTVQLQKRIVYVTVHEGSVYVRSKKHLAVAAGKTAGIYCSSPKQEILLVSRDVPAKIVMGTAAASAPAALIPQSGSKSDMSADDPSRR